ncbi:MAG: cytochrome c3 family protein [bacterium]|nr:cytochrome c3 family protein [bacterium]
MSRIPQQVIPLVVIFTLALAALIVGRQLLVPESFGDLGHYRADAVGEVAALDISYAGAQACLDCHEDIYDTKQEGHHQGLSCETCHGPAANHAEAPDEFLPLVPRGRDYCTPCHGYNPARPSGFPQIIEENHNPGESCLTCHNSHNPATPESPQECAACHRPIVNQKLVSHHTNVECTTCHTVPDEHMSNPRLVRAKRPTEPETCGQCHSRSANSSKNIPRIDMQTHGNRYNCWDCHYPHSPEANR